MDPRTYSGEQIATAARELRMEAGTEDERFSAAQAVSMLGEEVQLLRERGFSNERIADLFAGVDIEVSAAQIADAGKR